MINEKDLKKIIKRILKEMPQKSYITNPMVSYDTLEDYDIDPISSRTSIAFNKRSPQELMNLTHSEKYNYGQKLASSFLNNDIDVYTFVQPVDNAAVNYFEELYEFGIESPRSDRLLILTPEDYEYFIETRPDFTDIFSELNSQIENWINSSANNGNSCLFAILGDSIKNQKNPEGKVQWFTKTPWVLTHTLFHQVSTLSDRYFPLYAKAYEEYSLMCEQLFPDQKRHVLYPYLTFTAGNKRNQLDNKITPTDLPNELLVSFLRIVKFTGKNDTRSNLEFAKAFFMNDVPQDIIEKMTILVEYMKRVINEMFNIWRGNIVICVTENPSL